MSQIGCPYEPKFVGNASRVYPIDQKYMSHGKKRAGQKQTRSIEIALQEHREFHEDSENFATTEQLDRHMQLMLEAINEGASFIQAHEFALQNM